MKKSDWVLAMLFIFIGLSCLTMSAASSIRFHSIQSYANVCLQICLWGGFPLIVAAVVYIFMKRRKDR